MENILYYALPPFAIICFVFLYGLYTVSQHNAVVIERLGKFRAVKQAGLHFKLPFLDKVADKFSLRIQQHEINVETKTKENIFVTAGISVQFRINPHKIYDIYCLESAYDQISAHVYNVVRAEIPKMDLNDIFINKDSLANTIAAALTQKLSEHGIEIISVLTTDIDPDMYVKNAMNRINAADIEKSAAEYEAEAMRINLVAKAEAEAERLRLEGRGLADQRREIAKGLMESVDVLGKAGISSAEASALLMLSHHYDTLQAIGNESRSNLIMMPNSLQDSKEMISNMLASFNSSKEVRQEDPSEDDHKIIRFPNQENNGEFELYSNQL